MHELRKESRLHGGGERGAIAGSLAALCAAMLLLAATPAVRAADFAFEVASPKFRVTIPGIPPMKMGVHPLNAKQPHLRFLGTEGPYTISVFTPAAAAGMTALECASAIAKTFASRSGPPPSSQVYKLRLNENTFAALYTSKAGGGVVHLNAHFMSAAGGKHCVEVYATKVSDEPDELAPWFEGFGKARIDSN